MDNLVAACPSAEDTAAVQGQLENEPSAEKYARPEQYVIALMRFPRVSDRLKNWQYMKGFYGELSRFRACFAVNDKTLAFVLENRSFHALLRLLVTVGNFLNAGTARGRAVGLRLRALAKFSDTKDNSGHTLLFDVLRIARGLDSVAPDEAKAMAEYAAALRDDPVDVDLKFQDTENAIVPALRALGALVAKCRKTDYKEESDAFRAFQTQLSGIRGSVAQFSAGPGDKYPEVVQKFVESADFQVERLAEVGARVSERFAKIREVFGEPKAEPEELLNFFYQFSDSCLEQLAALEADDVRREREAQRARLAGVAGAVGSALSRAQSPAASPCTTSGKTAETGVIPAKQTGVQLVSQARKSRDIADSKDGVMDNLMSSFISHGNRRRR